MNLKKLATWLLVIGIIALIVGAVVGALTFNVGEFKEGIAEKKAKFFNKSEFLGCDGTDLDRNCFESYNKSGCDRSWKKHKKGWFWWKMWS